MKVSGPTGTSSTGGVIGARPAAPASAAGFQPAPSSVSEASETMGAASLNPVTSLEALMALQEAGGPLERRRRAVGRANTILSALEGLKLEMLEGRLTADAMHALTRAVREQRALTDDPQLEGLLDEVETRAAVELAKLEGPRLAA